MKRKHEVEIGNLVLNSQQQKCIGKTGAVANISVAYFKVCIFLAGLYLTGGGG